MILGYLKIHHFLEKVKGQVRGQHKADAKIRYYAADYTWTEDPNDDCYILVKRTDNSGDEVKLPIVLNLDESLISFFGLYSGDGAKGSQDPKKPTRIKPPISFSQREPNLVNFAILQFRRIFSANINFKLTLGEDSAYFFDKAGWNLLNKYYQGSVPPTTQIAPNSLSDKDLEYLKESRQYQKYPEEDLAFYYQHKEVMREILIEKKQQEINQVGLKLNQNDKVEASLRRPYKKGTREPGGSSRSDEIDVHGVTGFGELFLKIIHEVEDSISRDSKISNQGLVEWDNTPSKVGKDIELDRFFNNHPYGSVGNQRPIIQDNISGNLTGKWRRSKEITISKTLKIDPLWCYAAGLYLAEGSTSKETFFSMFYQSPSDLKLGFTSSENSSMDIILRALQKLFLHKDCLTSWKVKVGSQYFPEMVIIGLKNAVPMLRGGKDGQGKLRTMEISLALKEWALSVIPAMQQYQEQYSHAEPTAAGVPRIDFLSSSALCKWYFSLLMYATFGSLITNPQTEFQ